MSEDELKEWLEAVLQALQDINSELVALNDKSA